MGYNGSHGLELNGCLGGGGGWQISAISGVRKPNSIQVNRDCEVYILK